MPTHGAAPASLAAADSQGAPKTSPAIAPAADQKHKGAVATSSSLDGRFVRPNGPAAEEKTDDVISISQGIANLLAAEQRELPASRAATPAKSSSDANHSDPAPLFSEPPSYGRPRQYGGDDLNGATNSASEQGASEQSLPTTVPSDRRDADSCSELHKRLIAQIAEAMWFPTGTTESAREERLLDALDALQGIDPKDEMEGMLACQLVVIHRAALDCLQLSMAASADSSDRVRIIDQVEKLLAVHARDLAALDRHRRRSHYESGSETNEARSSIEETFLRLKAESARERKQTRSQSFHA